MATKCPYCTQGNLNKELIAESNKAFYGATKENYLDIEIGKDNYLHAFADLYEDPGIVGSIKINYCPICGRRLNYDN